MGKQAYGLLLMSIDIKWRCHGSDGFGGCARGSINSSTNASIHAEKLD